MRSKAIIAPLGWSHWSVGRVFMQDLQSCDAGTALSPSVTYRQALTDDSTIWLNHSVTWSSQTLSQTTHTLSPLLTVYPGTGWNSLDTSLPLSQRWQAH